MQTLPRNLVLEKNQLSGSEWLLLLDIALDDSTTIYLVKNTEDITFQGQVYTAFPIEIGDTPYNSKGELPTVELKVSNVSRLIQGYIESYDGLVGQTVVLRVVNAKHLTEDYSELELTFQVLSCTANNYWVSFSLGAPNAAKRRFPLHRYMADYCPWAGYFKSSTDVAEECSYVPSGSTIYETCTGSLEDCTLRNNTARFGGCPGLNKGGIKFA